METNTFEEKKHEENMDLTYSSAYQYYTVHSVTQHLVLSFLLNISTLLERLLLRYCVNTRWRRGIMAEFTLKLLRHNYDLLNNIYVFIIHAVWCVCFL